MSFDISQTQARRLWIKAQGLDRRQPFGLGASATPKVVRHLGYVQIDTIHVIERSHHHILFTRIPDYERSHLRRAQAEERSVFEYWTHALSYVPTEDYRFFVPAMKRFEQSPGRYLGMVKKDQMRKVLRMIKEEGALSIRDFKDDVLVDKDHEWASRKPSKKALQLGFYSGRLAIADRIGMLKKYELAERHFAWPKRPKAATKSEIANYLLDRALRSQAVVSLSSICHLNAKQKPDILREIERQVHNNCLAEVRISSLEKTRFWVRPETLDLKTENSESLVHILSPFDPLIIQRKRLLAFFDYDHRFEAYLPRVKRQFGYFALPVLIGDQIVASLDLKTDREKRTLRLQKWNWVGRAHTREFRRLIEQELDRFAAFQLAGTAGES